jgi:uncharacterized protein (DUF2267 family)
MTVPMEYAHASEQFERFLSELRTELCHETRHQTYHTLEGVLRVFRRRLNVRDALAFADALPAVVRAIFVADWDVEAPLAPFADLATLNAEVRSHQAAHNFAPPDSIETTAKVLARHVDRLAFEAALRRLPAPAGAFWKPS